MESLTSICWLAVQPLPKALHRDAAASPSVRLTVAQGVAATLCILGAVICAQALPLVARRAVDLLSHAGDATRGMGGIWAEAFIVARDIVCLVLGNTLFSTAHTWLFIQFADSSVIRLRVRALGSLISSSDGDQDDESQISNVPGGPVSDEQVGDNSTSVTTVASAGQGIHMLTSDAERLRRIISHELPTAIERVFAVIVSLVLMYQLSPSLTGVTVVMAGVGIFSLSYLAETVVYPAEKASAEQEKQATLYAQEFLHSSTTLRAFSRTRWAVGRYHSSLEQARESKLIAVKFKMAFEATVSIAACVVLVVIGGLCLSLISQGVLEPSSLLAFALFAGKLAVSLANFTRGYTEMCIGGRQTEALNGMAVQASRSHGDDEDTQISTLLREKKMKLRTGVREHLAAMTELSLQNVSYSYASTDKNSPIVHALSDVSLTFRLGQVVALAGPSGSGKSTVLRLLMRFCRPNSGQILIHSTASIDDVSIGSDSVGLHHRGKGKEKKKRSGITGLSQQVIEYDAQSFTLGDWRREIGYVGQDSILFTATIRENIELGLPEADHALLSRKALKEAVNEAAQDANVLEFTQGLPLGLDTPVGGGTGQSLSGGQVQRVALARALIRKARVLILDEHTSSLDTKSETAIQEALDRTKADRMTVLVAHRPAVVEQADCAFVLRNGRLVEAGSHAELVKKEGGTYAGLFA